MIGQVAQLKTKIVELEGNIAGSLYHSLSIDEYDQDNQQWHKSSPNIDNSNNYMSKSNIMKTMRNIDDQQQSSSLFGTPKRIKPFLPLFPQTSMFDTVNEEANNGSHSFLDEDTKEFSDNSFIESYRLDSEDIFQVIDELNRTAESNYNMSSYTNSPLGSDEEEVEVEVGDYSTAIDNFIMES